jgi:hypothetical protein
MSKLDLRFAVGSPSGLQSRVWRLWTHGNDVYCTVRDAGALLKISLHAADATRPPVCQLSVVAEFANALSEELKPPDGRHIERWSRQGPDANGDYLGTRILIPFESVKQREIIHLKPTVWLPVPQPSAAMEIALLFRPKGNHAPTPTAGERLQLLGASELPNGEQFRAVYYTYEINAQGHVNLQAYKERTKLTPMKWSTRPLTSDESGAGLLLFGIQEDGGHRVVDVDFDPTSRPAA